jgi:hypothetical protein
MTVEVEGDDWLAHYGKLGMRWGKHKAARLEKNANIDGARARQGQRQAEIRQLTAQRISANSAKGKKHLDSKIADKQFELKNNPDAHQAAQLKTAEKVMHGAKVTALLGLSVVGLGVAASIVNTELNRIDSPGGKYTNSEGGMVLMSTPQIYDVGTQGFKDAQRLK